MHSSEEVPQYSSIGNTSAQSDAGNPESTAASGDFTHPFAHGGRAVHGAFAGDHQVRAAQDGRETGVGGKEVEARLNAGAGKGLEAETKSAGRTGAGDSGQIAASEFLDAPGQSAKALFCQRDVFGSDSLLGSVNAGGAPEAEQWILDIDGDDHAECGEGVVLWRDHLA